LRAGAGEIEVLFAMAHAAGQHGCAKHEKNIPDDRADNRGLHHVMEPGAQGRERDDKLRCVAEGRIEKAANAFAGTVRQLFGGSPEPCRQRKNCDGGCCEDQRVMGRRKIFEANRDWDEA
jgi:hypothetical protein